MTATEGLPCSDLSELPDDVQRLVRIMACMAGVVAVALGGSRGTSGAHVGSDWDLAVYYRGTIDLEPLAPYGVVHPPGSWGRLMNGGAWFRVGDIDVDVILRDLDVVLHWTEQARQGMFELDALLGYIAGIPTYSLAAELASGRVLAGALPAIGDMPSALRTSAPARWRFSRDFSLEYARMHAARGNVAGVVGQVAKAAMEEAHARVCARGEWTLNEKRLLSIAGLDAVQDAFRAIPADVAQLDAWIGTVATTLSRE
ncbi:MAG: nucleotidyltransferase domain-containing protein [Gemmatimonadaceae bacterium]|nr:nucleotidyltransferase domain-containing protein [Gemmatimonadaceae bacterium]